MKKSLPLLMVALWMHIDAISQQVFEILESEEIRCNVSSTGDLFATFLNPDLPGFEAPAGSELKTIFISNLWVGGFSVDPSLKVAAETFQANGTDWFTGPLSNDGAAETSPETQQAWNHVWAANIEDVHNQQLYFNAISAGEPDPFNGTYMIPQWFYSWPAHGNVELGQDFFVAPFYDYDDNQFYNPEGGDFPLFCGDQCLFFIFNDKGGVHTESGGEALGIEIHCMMYTFDSPDPAISNTVFLKYKCINRSSHVLTNTYFGIWNDFDIGGPLDDYVGTNVARASVYAMNGDADDESSSASAGYGTDLPVQSMMVLAGPYADWDEYDNPLPDNSESSVTNSYGPAGYGYGDEIEDNERLGLTSSLYHTTSSAAVNGMPQAAGDFYNYLSHQWRDGSPIYSGGNGISGIGVTDVAADYMFPGDSDPLSIGTDGEEVPLWSDAGAGNTPGDRRILAGIGPITFNPGDKQPIDIAYVFSRQSEPGNEDPLAFHENREIEVKQYFDQNLVECEGAILPLSTPEISPRSTVSIFPNPADDIIQISTLGMGNQKQLTITDAAGRIIFTGSLSGVFSKFDISNLESGFYHLTVSDQTKSASMPLIVR